MKLATAGCPRNCSEATTKDVGAVAIEGGRWEIYVGGAAGSKVRKGDIFCTVATQDDVLQIIGRFMQYYREHARYLERTYDFVERVGIDVPQASARRRRRGHLRANSMPRCRRRSTHSSIPGRSAMCRCTRCSSRLSSRPPKWSPSHECDGAPHLLGPLDRIPLGEARVFRVEGRDVAVFRCRSGEVFATSAECPHRGGPSPTAWSAAIRSFVRCTGSCSTCAPATRRDETANGWSRIASRSATTARSCWNWREPRRTHDAVAGFGGARVALLESRLADETSAMVKRLGGDPVSAPSLEEAPVDADEAIAGLVERLSSGPAQVIVFLTGAAVARVFAVAERLGVTSPLRDGLARAVIVARGPKPAGALARWGVTPLSERSPNRLRPPTSSTLWR